MQIKFFTGICAIVKKQKEYVMINNLSFNGGKTTATKYLERKAAAVEADLAENIRLAARNLMKENRAAAKSGNYIPDSAYYGVVPTSPRRIGANKTMKSLIATKQNVQVPSKNVKEEIVPENSINFFG